MKVVSGVLALVFWSSSFVVWMYFASSRPRTYLPEVGRTFPLNSHGSIVYLTFGEYYLLYGLMAAGIGLFFLSAVCYFFGRERLRS
jgi:hypothetical protein